MSRIPLLDYFAGQALAGQLAGREQPLDVGMAAGAAYIFANAMMKARADNVDRRGVDSISVEEMGLSSRSKHALVWNNIKTVGELRKKSDTELLSMRAFGRVSLQEVKDKLAKVIALDTKPEKRT